MLRTGQPKPSDAFHCYSISHELSVQPGSVGGNRAHAITRALWGLLSGGLGALTGPSEKIIPRT